MRIAKRVLIVLLLAAVVVGGVVYSLRRGPRAAQGGGVPELIELAPADAAYLFYANIAAFRSASLMPRIDEWAATAPRDRDYDEFVRATGLEYARDLDDVVFAVRPAAPAGRNVALAEGRFDRARIISYALRTGKLERQNGFEVYVVPNSSSPAKSFSFAFLDNNRVALAEGPSLELAQLPRASGTLDPAMRERIARVAGSALFIVGKVSQVPENFSLGGMRSDQFTNLARSLRWFTLAARLEGDRLRVVAEGECDTPDSARQLEGTLDGLRSLGQALLADSKTRQKLGPEDVGKLETLLRMVEFSRDAQRVRVMLELTPEMLKAMSPKKPAAHTSSP